MSLRITVLSSTTVPEGREEFCTRLLTPMVTLSPTTALKSTPSSLSRKLLGQS